MTKLFSILLISALLVLSITACSDREADSVTESETPYSAEADGEENSEAQSSDDASDSDLLIDIDNDDAVCSLPSEDVIVFHDDNPTYDPNYSHNSLIISCDFSRCDEVEEIFEALKLSIMYKYENFSMYAVNMERDFSDRELDELISVLESYDCIYAAEKNGIMTIDGEGSFSLD